MQLVLNNPYRISGILVGTSAKEEHSKLRKLKMYIEADQEVPEDFSFPSLGNLNRSLDNINQAASRLNLNSDRINAALFWFYSGYHTDEPAFDAIKANETEKAIEIWTKLTSSGEITQRNYSAYQNLSTLYLQQSVDVKKIDYDLLEKGIALKLIFLESDFIKDYKTISTDETFLTTKGEMELSFLTDLLTELNKITRFDSKKLLAIIDVKSFLAKGEFIKTLVQKPLMDIEGLLNQAKAERKANPAKGLEIGQELYKNTKAEMALLQKALGKNDIKLGTLSDKLSDEILQCGIVYFKKYKDSKDGLADEVLALFALAAKYAVGNMVKERHDENVEHLHQWKNDEPIRLKTKQVKPDLDAVLQLLLEYENDEESILNAQVLLHSVDAHLKNIKNALGKTDELYLRMSTNVAAAAQSYLISEVNEVQSNLDVKIARDRFGTINRLKTTLQAAKSVMEQIGALDMEANFRKNQYLPNKNSLNGLCEQLGVGATRSYASSNQGNYKTSTSNSSSSMSAENQGCIAVIICVIIGVAIGFGAAGAGGAFAGLLVGGAVGGFISKAIS
jgi:hypothetical protein